ncbi:MAG: hypothetical protein M1352_01625 [Patescibacteria group bacterium]|nr:hypothetical protein [Patescibacteria group bacterium]
MGKSDCLLGLLRLALGWIFFWAFLDKVFGLGFSTKAGHALINGVSPTLSFLKFATKGPFTHFYQSLAGNPAVDWLFMLGLLFVGLTLILGIAVKLGSFFGALMLLIFYSAAFLPPTTNPFVDEHIVYSLILLSFIFSNPGRYLGLGSFWQKIALVKRFPLLE